MPETKNPTRTESPEPGQGPTPDAAPAGVHGAYGTAGENPISDTLPGIGRLGAPVALGGLLAGCPQPIPQPPNSTVRSPEALPENLRRLVSRISFGINKEEATIAQELGYAGYLEYQLDHLNIDDGKVEGALASFSTLDDSPLQRLRAIERGDTASVYEFYAATILRGAFSRRPLFERMAEFWSDHFNIYFESEAQQILKPLDDAEVIRPNALGTFPDLLRASVHSPSMLLYLDNASSRAGAPNENYARELMELHTVGVDNFTQGDVREVARALTGWSIDINIDAATFGRFKFYPEIHDFGEKYVLGHRLRSGQGITDGEEVIDILALDPQISAMTARHLARKLAVHFWGYDPPEALVDEIAQAYGDTGGDIKAMLRVVLREDWIAQAPPKLKRPYHYALSAMRARPSEILDFQTLAGLMISMEHLPFQWAPPNGYPDALAYWGNYLMPRWTFGIWLVYQDSAISIDWTPYFEAPDTDAFLDQLDADFFHFTLPADHRAALADFLAAAPSNPFRRVEALSLAIGSAAFQWY